MKTVRPCEGPNPSGARASKLERCRPRDANALGSEYCPTSRVAEGDFTNRRGNELAIRSAFETAGVEFIDENGGGPGVRLRNRLRKG